jgi:hypothetical protein
MVASFWNPPSTDLRAVSRQDQSIAAIPFGIATWISAFLFWNWINGKFNQLVGRTDREKA